MLHCKSIAQRVSGKHYSRASQPCAVSLQAATATLVMSYALHLTLQVFEWILTNCNLKINVHSLGLEVISRQHRALPCIRPLRWGHREQVMVVIAAATGQVPLS